jgi:dTDP-4-amino-4,6-dideoxygalactose transaminase
MTKPVVEESIVPFVDLSVDDGLKAKVLTEIAELIDSSAFSNGPEVARFEEAFAAYCGAPRCVGLASGLDALRLGLIAAGVTPGDEVVVPAQTFVATVEAVIQSGASPVLADISESDYGLDPVAAEAASTERTRVLLPVHLYGQLADMRALGALAERHELLVIEDACQAHGATRDGLRAGSIGTAAAFSFYPAKNLGAMGDAGALTTADNTLADTVVALREHGQSAKYVHSLEGFTARLDTVQALFLLHKLPLLEAGNEARRQAAGLYLQLLEGVGDLRLPSVAQGSDPVWHLIVVRTADPDRLGAALRERGIRTGRHYPIPVHLNPAYRRLGYREGSFPVAEALARECLSIPLFPGISESQVTRVTDAIKDYFSGG